MSHNIFLNDVYWHIEWSILLWHKWPLTALYIHRTLQGWGFLSRFAPFLYFFNFSASPKYTLAIEYHVHIWQVSLQLSCGDTCQIWMRFKEWNRYFWEIENWWNGALVTPTQDMLQRSKTYDQIVWWEKHGFLSAKNRGKILEWNIYWWCGLLYKNYHCSATFMPTVIHSLLYHGNAGRISPRRPKR